jgi:hypothetical protein
LEKIAYGDFFETLHDFRPQKAGFLRPAQQGDFFETLHDFRRLGGPGYAPPTKSVVFAAYSAQVASGKS